MEFWTGLLDPRWRQRKISRSSDQDGGVDQEVGKQANRGRKKWINPTNTPAPIKKKPDSVIVCGRAGVSKAGGLNYCAVSEFSVRLAC